MSKNKKPNETDKNKDAVVESTVESELQEMIANENSVATFSYGLAESIFMEDLDSRTFYIDDVVDSNIFRELNMFIIKLNAIDKGLKAKERQPIKIVISSNGGSVLDGLGTINCIRNSTTPIIAVCTSYACSIAFYIFASAHIRIAAPDAVFLNHDGETGIFNSSSKTEDTIEFYKRVDERLRKTLVSRSKFTMKELEDTKRIESYYFGNEGKELGFVDALIGEDVDFDDIFGCGDSYDCEGHCTNQVM